MTKKRKIPEEDGRDIYDQFYNLNSVSSATELTGLIPSLPHTEFEAESYEQVYGVPVPSDIENDKNKKHA